jgi:hypothetical protein
MAAFRNVLKNAMEMTNNLPEIPRDRTDDIHNLQWADECDLVLFMAGNQL